MTTKPKPKKRCVLLVCSSCQPSKKELAKPVEFPDDLAPDELAETVAQPVEIDWKPQPD